MALTVREEIQIISTIPNTRTGQGILDEQRFWAKAGTYCGIPHIGWGKKACDFILTLKEKLKYHPTH